MTLQSTAPAHRRQRAMRIIAAVMAVAAIGFGLFTLVFAVVGPDQEQHAFHNVVVATLLLVLSAPPAIVVARRPADDASPVELAALAVAGVATMMLSLTLDPFTLPFVVLIVVFWLLRTSAPAIVPSGRFSIPMLALVVVAAAPLLTYAAGQAELQRTDHSSAHAAFFHWVETAFYAVAIVLLGALAGLRPVVYRLAAWMSGIALTVFGAGALLLSGYASAPDTPWGWAALAGGVGFIGLAEWEARRSGQAVQRSNA